MQFDIVFTDSVCYKPYSPQTLRDEPLGGTEASVIRVAEALSQMPVPNMGRNLRVAVLQHNRTQEEAYGAFYLPINYLNTVNTVFHVLLRGITYYEYFPKAIKFSWQHDLPDERLLAWRDILIQKKIKLIAVSKWHRTQIRQIVCDANVADNPKVTYIYNPIPDDIFFDKKEDIPYNPNKLVWMSSPHKGLDKALEVFNNLKAVSGNDKFELHVFNPGYMQDSIKEGNGIKLYGAMPCAHMWNRVKDALCLFYPSMYKETFGLVAAECNAMHVPVATYENAGLAETVNGYHQLLQPNDEKGLIDRVISWSKGHRPVVLGKHKFKTSEVINEWISVLSSSRVE